MTPDFSPHRLQPFRPEHEEGVIALIRGCYADYGQVIELDTLDQDLRHIAQRFPPPGSAFRVLLDPAGTVVGSAAVHRVSDQECELKRVFLVRDLRGQGLGKRMVQWAFGFARAQGYREMHVWSDVKYETAHALYRHLGCEDPRRRRKLGGVNDVDEFYFRKLLEEERPAAGSGD